MKILLINPPARELQFEPLVIPPLGLLYLAGVLIKNNYDVEIMDCFALGLSWNEFEKRMKYYDIIGVTGMTPIIDNTYKALKIARKFTENLVLGGPHATVFVKEMFNRYKEIDFIIQGEGEFSFLELVKKIEQGNKDFSDIPGIATRDNINPVGKFIETLDILPFPARNLLPLENYKYPFARNGRVTSIITSRGCPYSCIFCDKTICGSKWRARTVENVIKELIQIKKDFNISNIIIYDDLFILDKKRVQAICRKIIEEDLAIHWKCEGRVNTVDEETLGIMKKAGCEMIAYGVESGNQKGLEYLGKGIDLCQIEKAFKMTHNAGIKTMGYFILGIPVETFEEAKKTINFAIKINTDYAQFSILSPMPGTRLYDEAIKNGWYKEIDAHNPMDKDLKRPVVISEHWDENKLEEIIKLAHNQFYMRPTFLIKSLFEIKNWQEFSEKFKIFSKMLTYVRRT